MASLAVNFIVFVVGCSSSTMFVGILAIFSVSLVVTKTAESTPTAVVKARQFLVAKPGYIPVYIKNDDTPLEEINSDLAEAFRSYDLKHGRITYGRQILNTISDARVEKTIKKEQPINKARFEINEIEHRPSNIHNKRITNVHAIPVSIFTDNSHIQKIPRL